MIVALEIDGATEANIRHIKNLIEEEVGVYLSEEDFYLYIIYALNEGLLLVANRIEKETLDGGREFITSSQKRSISFMNHFFLRETLKEC